MVDDSDFTWYLPRGVEVDLLGQCLSPPPTNRLATMNGVVTLKQSLTMNHADVKPFNNVLALGTTIDLMETKEVMVQGGTPEENIVMIKGDLRNADVQKNLVEATVKKFGGIDILVNNAGGGGIDNSSKQGLDQELDNYDYILELNTRSVVALCKLALPYLVERQGEIIMVSSICGLAQGCPSLPYYSMSKGALDQLMRALAVEYIGKGVRVNSVK
ncbi:hypothetical protein RB195_017563 [Necator americanus]|uniref:Oxidoreductase, short chain dehydrogenase/reductase family protein n=1 Tax=Necator americanus TaxID=51031 RepID=A0ABR1C855_NECAM